MTTDILQKTGPTIFVPLCLGKGVTHNRKKLSCLYRLAATDVEIPRKYWTALRRSEPFVQLGHPHFQRQYLYEAILGPAPDGHRILYKNGDPLDLRVENLEYVLPSKYLVNATYPNSVVSTLPGYEQAIQDTYHRLEDLQKQWNGRSWAQNARASLLSRDEVVALLTYYVDRYTEKELEHSEKHKRAGIDLETCQEFLQDRGSAVPSIRQLRRILSGECLYVVGEEVRYRKAAQLLPCQSSLLTPEPKGMFRPAQPTTTAQT